MRSIRRKISLICVTSLVLSIVSFSTVFAADSKSILESITKDYLATSVQYAVISGDKIIKSGTGGVYSKTEVKELTADTMYGIGSVSKMFTTVAVMKLVEQGKVNLDSPVTTYIPEFKMADERYSKITVRMLLNHSSGLLGSSFNNAFLVNETNSSAKDQLLANLAQQRLKADPGAFSVYCNDGFTLAEILVERVSEKTFTDFIHEYITTPLNMKNTKTPVDTFDRNRLSKIYLSGSDVEVPNETTNIIGTGGIYSTAEDMCRFAQIFMKDSTIGRNVLGKSSIDAMASKEYLKGIWPEETSQQAGILSFGLGWDNVNGQAFIPFNTQELTKGGDTLYYHGILVVLPEKNLAAAVYSSGGVSTFDQFLAEALLKETLVESKQITGESTSDKNILDTVKSSTPTAVAIPDDLLQYEGYYGSYSFPNLIKMDKAGTLTLSVPDMQTQTQTLYHQGNNKFIDRTGLMEITFVKEVNGNVYLKTSGLSMYPGLGNSVQSLYTGQKLENNPLDEETLKAWDARSNKAYFIVNERASSAAYLMLAPVTVMPDFSSQGGLKGYLTSNKIVDKDNAINPVQIPGVAGRDLQDFKFYRENNIEFLKVQGNIAISEDQVTTLYNGRKSVCTIGNDGNAKWYGVGKAAGKTITVDIPEKASFSVYENYAFKYSSLVDSKKTLTLPKDGYMVFAGEPGSKFTITLN